MTTTITATPRPESAAVDLRVVRDDTETTDVVVEWTRGTEAENLAEKATWDDPSKFLASTYAIVTGGASKTFEDYTPGQRAIIELWASGAAGGWKINGTIMQHTRETATGGGGRFVWEGVLPSGGVQMLFDMPSNYTSSVYGYRITYLDDQRIMLGPDIASGQEAAWTLDAASPFGNQQGAWSAVSSELYFTWWSNATIGVVAAGALKASRSITTTATRDYVITTQVQATDLGSSTGLVVEVLNGTTVLASQDVTTNADATVKLSFTAPTTSVTLRVSNRQPFSTPTTDYNARYYVRSLLVERLPADDLSLATYTITSLSRTDSNGVHQVRLPRNADLVEGLLESTDYEPAMDGLIAYTAVTERVGASGSREIATTSTRLDLTGNVFMDASLPALRFDAEIVETYGATNATSAVFHDVIGRADPVVSEGVQRLRAGTMRIWFRSYEDAKEAIQAFGRGKTMLWRSTDNAGLDMYFRSVDVSSAPYDAQVKPRRWYVSLDFREVATPTAPIETDVAWNFSASAERNATFFDSFMEFSTFADLLNGPEVV